MPKEHSKELFDAYTAFEKKYGDRKGVDSVILNKRQFQYEKEVQENPHNYDAWFDYIRLAESSEDVDKARDVYERAIANVPPLTEKKYWRRYIYLWIYYAVYEELEAKVRAAMRSSFGGGVVCLCVCVCVCEALSLSLSLCLSVSVCTCLPVCLHTCAAVLPKPQNAPLHCVALRGDCCLGL